MTLEEKLITFSGVVYVDETDDEVVSGAAVTITIGGTEFDTTETDSNGEFSIASVPTKAEIVVTITMEGYTTLQESYTSATLSDSFASQTFNLVSSNITTTITGSVTNVNGAVSGASVSTTIDGQKYSAETNANGEFTFTGIPKATMTLTVTKEGYIDTTLSVSQASLTSFDTSTLDDIDMMLDYNDETVTIGDKISISKFTVSTSRTASGLYFEFATTSFASYERLQFYIYAGTNSDNIIYMYPDGSFTATNNTGIVYTATSSLLTLYIPYTTLNMNSTDVFGFAAGVWSTTANEGAGDWNPIVYNETTVAENTQTTYLRVDAYNNIYEATSNIEMVTLSGYVRDESEVAISGATVTYNGVTATTATDGSYSIMTEKPSSDSDLTVTRDGYESETATIYIADYVANKQTANLTLEEKLITFGGTISDDDGVLNGATVTITIGGETFDTTTTVSNGEFSIASVPTKDEITVTITMEGYTTLSNSDSSNLLSNQSYENMAYTLVSSSVTLTLTGSVTNILGVVSGASVSTTIDGQEYSATTNASGEFTIENAPKTNMTLTITNDGYEDASYAIEGDNLTASTTNDLGDIDMMLEYASLGSFGTEVEMGGFNGYVSRSATGFEFEFVSVSNAVAFTTGDSVDIFVYTKTTTFSADHRMASVYRFYLTANGSTGYVTIENYASGGNTTVPSNLAINITTDASDYTTILFTLPYAFFSQAEESYAVSSTEVIGLSFGVYDSSTGGWNGWVFYGAGTTYDGVPYVESNMTADYIRLSKENILYWSQTNTSVDLSGYTITTGNGTTAGYSGQQELTTNTAGDNFFGTVSRDTTGITFDFIGFGSFDDTEFVMIFLDLGETSLSGWNVTSGEDYQFKIYGNGDVYYKSSDSPWWKTDREDDDSKYSGVKISVDTDTLMISFSITIKYKDIGIEASDTIGFAVREGIDSGDNWADYAPWYDSEVLGVEYDAADQTAYARIDSNGNLYFASSNTVVYGS